MNRMEGLIMLIIINTGVLYEDIFTRGGEIGLRSYIIIAAVH